MLAGLLAASLSLTGSLQEPVLEFGSDVRMIRLDVSVVSKKGVPVAGLLPEDFEIFENGRRVELSFFRAFTPDEPRGIGDAVALPVIDDDSLVAPPRRVILLMDVGLMGLGELHRARQSAESFLREHTSEGDWVRIINRSTGRAWGGFIPQDRARLVSAIRSIGWRNDSVWGPGGQATDPIVDSFEAEFAGSDPFGPSEAMTNEVFLSQFARTSGLLGLLEAIMVQLSGVDGRKALVLISPGFPQLRDLDRKLQEVATLAREASTTVYYVDSRGLEGLIPEPGRRLRPAFEMAWARSGGAQDLATATGGFTARFSNSLTRALSRVAAEMRTYYVLGYRPTRPDDGRFRKVRVEVNVDGVEARTKKGYLAGRRR